MQIGVIDSNSPLTLNFFNAEQDRQTLNGSHSHIYGNISTLLNMFVSVPDVGGQRCPDSVRNYCAVSVGQNQVQIQNPDTRKPYRLKISDLD